MHTRTADSTADASVTSATSLMYLQLAQTWCRDSCTHKVPGHGIKSAECASPCAYAQSLYLSLIGSHGLEDSLGWWRCTGRLPKSPVLPVVICYGRLVLVLVCMAATSPARRTTPAPCNMQHLRSLTSFYATCGISESSVLPLITRYSRFVLVLVHMAAASPARCTAPAPAALSVLAAQTWSTQTRWWRRPED